MTKVIALRKTKASNILDDIEIEEKDFRKIIVIGLRNKISSGMRMYEIAEKTGLCHTTISNLLCEKTKFPRFETIRILMKFLGYKLVARKVN